MIIVQTLNQYIQNSRMALQVSNKNKKQTNKQTKAKTNFKKTKQSKTKNQEKKARQNKTQ